jgi:peptidoglycan/xylan/chitin deacetylase (PgdA/CDA1 family)
MEYKEAVSIKSNSEGNPHRVKVLIYHRVVDDEALSLAHPWCIHARDYRRHLELLDEWGYTGITFEDYRLFLQGELNLPKKPVIITFDDGYLDTYQIAYPLLQEYGMKAVVFVLGDRSITSNAFDARRQGFLPAGLMDGYHILELHESGFEIGAHSMTHAVLTKLPGEKAWEEISNARIALEILLNSPVRSFAYPYGIVNQTVKEMVARAGYDIACGVFSGPATFGLDAYDIRRIPVLNSTRSFGFTLRMLMPFQHLEWLRWKSSGMISRGKKAGSDYC